MPPVALILVAATLAIAASAPAGGIVFSDGFESGNLNLWTGKTGMAVQQQEVFAGAWAARGTTTGTAAYASETLSPTRSDLYTDVRFKVLSQGNVNVGLMRFRTSTNGAIFSIMRRNDGRLFSYNEVTGASTASTTTITTGVWHELEVHGVINGTSGKVEVWYDGTYVTSISKTENLGTNPLGRIYIGDPGTGKTWDVAYDAVTLSTSSDLVAPSTPTGVTATVIGSNHVNIMWNPSTDNVGVTAYRVYRGGVAIGTVGGHATGSADFGASPSTSYTYTVDATDGTGNRSPQSGPASATTPPSSGGDPMIMAVGDIACDPDNPNFFGGTGTAKVCRQQHTSDIPFTSNPTAILTLGDSQYENNDYGDYQIAFDPAWGRVKSIIHPVPGNHEYLSPGAGGYYQYFGAAAGDPTKGYYSYDIGAWHIIALSGECAPIGGCDAGSPQEQWLKEDLAAHPATCTLAYWHEPRFSSGLHGEALYSAFWQDLYGAGADVILNGHDHDYERFAPQSPSQQPDPVGIREFVVGTGGEELKSWGNIEPNSEVRNNTTFGVLQLTLHGASYDWTFVPETGSGSFTDTGTGACH
jgi:calcineurin-like phosphoesterase family protein